MPDHIKSLSDSSVHGAVVLNPDGSNIGSSPSLPTDAATETEQQAQTALLTTIEANQLPDGHNVTIDNASIAVTGTVTADLSATDNAVLDSINLELQKLNSLVPAVYDYISLTYTGDNLTSVVFKTGGSGGTTVSTLTLAYTGDRLDSVTKT